MISWIKHKNLPKYWKQYISTFKRDQPNTIENTRFVVFDTETTGLNTSHDRILSIGAVSLNNNTINVADSFEVYLEQDEFNSNTVKIHGILKKGNLQKISEKKAIKKFLGYINNSVLVAHHTSFDIEMINNSLNRINLPKLKNKKIDTGNLYKKLENRNENNHSLDSICEEFNIPRSDRHTSSGDAYITALLFLKIMSKLKKERKFHFSDLFRNSNKKGLL